MTPRTNYGQEKSPALVRATCSAILFTLAESFIGQRKTGIFLFRNLQSLMENHMRKLLTLCVLAAFAIVIAGCDPKPENTEAVPPPSNKDELMKQYGKGGKGMPTPGPSAPAQ